ncbi:NlpC/P60 family protein [Brevundimonas sp.]|uniref:NlpC/P60 family protein n=1 Tax=Brevundimonas sp. TaxID=1871086 RepID=UPI00261BB504|nr:NlpC/P60 family protein [Brevundimonas sp.]
MSARVVALARDWIGTPYRHQASAKGVGADCLGLIRGLWREVVGPEPAPVPPYSPDWAEVGGAETLLEAARAWLVEVHPAQARPGDVLVFRMSRGAPAKHCGVLSAEGPTRKMVHAYWGRAVVESWMGRFWEDRLAAVFRWPREVEA